MKTTKRLLSCLLVLAMLFALAIPAFAADGSNKITVTDAAIGENYKLVKLFDATQVDGRGQNDNGIVYTGTIPESLKPYFTENATTKEITANKATLSTKAIEDITAWAKNYAGNEGVDVWMQTAESNMVVFDNLPDGYYVVVSEISEAGGVISVTSATPNATVADKNTGDGPEKPDGDKKVKTIVGAAGDQTQASADLGAKVEFSVEFKGGNYYAKEVTENGVTKTERILVTYYTVVDTPVGMTLSEKAHVTIATDPVKKFDVDIKDGKIVIPWAENGVSLYPNKVDVTVTYTGTITGSNASNTAVVNPNGENEGGTTPEDPVKVYTSNIIVDKVLKEGNDLVSGTKIPGAKFVLTKTVEENGEDVIKYYSYDGKTVSWVDSYEATDTKVVYTTDKDGAIKFVGLADGDYELVEIEAPAGYNKLEKSVPVTVNAVEETTVNGEKVHKISYTEQIGNSKGTVLPSTGGIGTTMFYVVGGLLVAAAVVVLVSKKRMGAEQ